ncbi:hypothetical protein [Rhodococcus sp. ACPA1]|uniref:hypothetical protein n=1 Tax=Rhodococcus sp. ACPA1 TaxID=2028572 RepID=UPI0015C9EA40|nr:hypothetical protein [Rhodococcus sp. ACPA1]
MRFLVNAALAPTILYAAGNSGGAPTKGFYGGAGGTISLGLVFGYLAGQEAARRRDDA